MKFSGALGLLTNGHTVTRHSWSTGDYLECKGPGYRCIRWKDGHSADWSPRGEDLDADDWECFTKNLPASMKFGEAFEFLRKGTPIRRASWGDWRRLEVSDDPEDEIKVVGNLCRSNWSPTALDLSAQDWQVYESSKQTPLENTYLKFADASDLLIRGTPVRRESWPVGKRLSVIHDSIRWGDSSHSSNWRATATDLGAHDWQVFESSKETPSEKCVETHAEGVPFQRAFALIISNQRVVRKGWAKTILGVELAWRGPGRDCYLALMIRDQQGDVLNTEWKPKQSDLLECDWIISDR